MCFYQQRHISHLVSPAICDNKLYLIDKVSDKIWDSINKTQNLEDMPPKIASDSLDTLSTMESNHEQTVSAPSQASHVSQPSMFTADPYPRLSIATPTRLLLGSISSGIVGFTLGAMQGGQMAQLRFRAEHAHKMPDTTTGWYFYHKSKNYHAMQGGIREGFRMSAKTGFWSFVALGLESTVDRYRGCSDMLSTMVATLSVAGMFSLTRE